MKNFNSKGYSPDMLAVAISENALNIFTETRLLRRKRLNVHRYFGAYQYCFELGAGFGYRFEMIPEALFSLFAKQGGVQDSLDFVRQTVSEQFGNQIGNAHTLWDLAPEREEKRIINELKTSGRINENSDLVATRESLKQINVLDSAADSLALAVTLGAGVGLYYPDNYEQLVSADERKEMMNAVESVFRGWIKEYGLSILMLTKEVDLRINPMLRELIGREMVQEKNYDVSSELLNCFPMRETNRSL